MSDREWWVKVNLDDLSHDLDQLESTNERGQWLEGFRVGSRGHQARDGWSPQKMLGFSFGVKCNMDAQAFREMKAQAGRASADARRAKYGSAAPNSDRTLFEQRSIAVRTGVEQTAEQSPEQSANQPTANSQQPTANNEKPKRAKGAYASEVLAIYDAYPRKDGPGSCSKQIIAALEIEPFDSLLEATQAFCAAVRKWDQEDQDQYTPMASTWFSQQRWLADRKTWERKSKTKTLKNGVQHNGFAETDYTAGLDSVPSY